MTKQISGFKRLRNVCFARLTSILSRCRFTLPRSFVSLLALTAKENSGPIPFLLCDPLRQPT